MRKVFLNGFFGVLAEMLYAIIPLVVGILIIAICWVISL